MLNKKDLSKIGIGTWGIGGFAERNPENDDRKHIDCLKYAIKKGLNIVELNMWLAGGHGTKLVSEAYKESKIKRDKVFLKQGIYRFSAKTLNEGYTEIESVLKLFNTDTLDTFELGLPNINFYGFKESIKFMKMLLENKITRFVSLANSDLETLKNFHSEFGDKLFSSEVGFNFEIRENEDYGIMKYAEDNNILNIIFQPLRRNRTAIRNYPLLVELSKKYNKTQNQIIINWIIGRNLLPLIKTDSIEHLDENLAALGFKVEKNDLEKLNEYRVNGWKTPKIDWHGTGDGTKIDQLSNVFNELM
jgi:diketogulonate reductase-like aldo/keto reductase